MKKLNIIMVLLACLLSASAQQLHISSFYDLQGLLHNPAVAGTQGKNIVAATYRTQWSGISGAPKTQAIFGSFNLTKFNAGIGGYIFNDVTGPTSRRGVNLDLAKHIVLNEDAVFSLGIETKLQQYAIDKNKLTAALGSDPVLGTSENKMKFDAGFGIAYVGKKLQIGASVSQLVQSKLQFYSGNLNRSQEARLYRHYFLHANYKWSDGTTKVIPNFLATYLPNAPFEFQGGVNIEHNNVFWWGVGYRLKQSFMLNAGLILNNKVRIGYAFDAYQTPLSTFENGFNAHEIGLRYEF
jgi:type IX secretion system PorP/SprF family membrane protein